MEDFRVSRLFTSPLPPFRSLLILLGFVLLGMSLGSLLAGALLVGWLASLDETTMLSMGDLLKNPEQFNGSWYLLISVQAVSHLFTFLFPCLLYLRAVEHRHWNAFNSQPFLAVRATGLVALATIALMPFNSLIIEWNQTMDLPDSWMPLEQWMKQKEDQLSVLTTFLTTFESPLDLIIALLVIAIIPAVGEELLFRGLLQNKLTSWIKNQHAAIWIAAIIFSAIHMQFYGFLPRVLLGALFGYLYCWSGNIGVPMLAHFVNNGFTVLMIWLYHRQIISVNIENADIIPWFGVVCSLGLTIGLLYFFRRSQLVPPPYS